jgi:hypothetical protein
VVDVVGADVETVADGEEEDEVDGIVAFVVPVESRDVDDVEDVLGVASVTTGLVSASTEEEEEDEVEEMEVDNKEDEEEDKVEVVEVESGTVTEGGVRGAATVGEADSGNTSTNPGGGRTAATACRCGLRCLGLLRLLLRCGDVELDDDCLGDDSVSMFVGEEEEEEEACKGDEVARARGGEVESGGVNGRVTGSGPHSGGTTAGINTDLDGDATGELAAAANRAAAHASNPRACLPLLAPDLDLLLDLDLDGVPGLEPPLALAAAAALAALDFDFFFFPLLFFLPSPSLLLVSVEEDNDSTAEDAEAVGEGGVEVVGEDGAEVEGVDVVDKRNAGGVETSVSEVGWDDVNNDESIVNGAAESSIESDD